METVRLVRFQMVLDLDDLETQRLRRSTGVLWSEPVRGYCVIVIGVMNTVDPSEATLYAKEVMIDLVPRTASAPLLDIKVAAIDGPDGGFRVTDEQVRDFALGR